MYRSCTEVIRLEPEGKRDSVYCAPKTAEGGPLDNREGFVIYFCLHSVALTLICSHIAADRVFFVGAWHITLIGRQQVTLAIGAAARVSCINRRASG
jgi:hypothetical protein